MKLVGHEWIPKTKPEMITERCTHPKFDRTKIVSAAFMEGLLNNYIARMKNSSLADSSLWQDNMVEPELWRKALEPASNVISDCPTGSKQAFYVEKLVVKPEEQVLFMGDLHGSVHSLLRSLWRMVYRDHLNNQFKLAPGVHLTFLGDMIDYGTYGIEVLSLVLSLKLANWDVVHIIRGNHENGSQSYTDGFKTELNLKYSATSASNLHTLFQSLCFMLPCAIFVGCMDASSGTPVFIQACHGGVEPRHNTKEFLANSAARYTVVTANEETVHANAFNSRYFCVDEGMCVGVDHQWGDGTGIDMPASYKRNYDSKVQYITNTERGCGFKLPQAEITQLLRNVKGVSKIIRGHKDYDTAMMFLCNGENLPVDWRFNAKYASMTPEQWSNDGENFANMPNHITLSSAAEGKNLLEEGYGELHMAPNYNAWHWFLHSNNLVDRAELKDIVASKEIDSVAIPADLQNYADNRRLKDKNANKANDALWRRNATFVYIGFDKKRVKTAGEAGVAPELIESAQRAIFEDTPAPATGAADGSGGGGGGSDGVSPDDIRMDVSPVDPSDGAGAGTEIAVEA